MERLSVSLMNKISVGENRIVIADGSFMMGNILVDVEEGRLNNLCHDAEEDAIES